MRLAGAASALDPEVFEALSYATQPPTGTMKFLSRLDTTRSTLPTRHARLMSFDTFLQYLRAKQRTMGVRGAGGEG